MTRSTYEAHMQPDTRVRIKNTGEIGYVVQEEPNDMLYIRIPSDNNWPFPSYAYLKRKAVVLVKVVKNQTPTDIEEAPF
jgi:hypothetical protein